jgi:hypothetical protein
MARLRLPYFALCLGVIVILGGGALHLLAVTSCVPPDVLTPNYAFKIGAAISVTASNFPPALQPCVQKAFDNWNAANDKTNPSGNFSGVKFTVTYGSPVSTTNQVNVYQVTYSSKKPDGTALSDPGVTSGQANAAGTARINANTSINTSQTTCDQVTVTTAHEIGHTLGAGDCSQCTDPSQSVEFGRIAPFGVPPYNTGPTPCDNSTVDSVYHPSGGGIPGCQPDCPIGSRTCVPCGGSPIILDVSGNGFHLTSAANGVRFDISGTGNPIQMGWTTSGSDNAFLALPGPDGLVHSGKQLFGNFTPQPPSNQPNGFIALAVYDDPANGGNGDGIIDARDDVYLRLRLWVDANHDGVSQPSELYTLPSLGVYSISLNYTESRKTDQYGNQFRYRARVNGAESRDVGQTAYDVFFVGLPGQTAKNNGCFVPSARIMPAKAGGR